MLLYGHFALEFYPFFYFSRSNFFEFKMSKEQIEAAFDIVKAIEEAIAANGPYENPLFSSDTPLTLQDCEIPDHIYDPLLLLRIKIGNEKTRQLEYISDIELIAHALQSCIDDWNDAQAREQKGDSKGEEPRHS